MLMRLLELLLQLLLLAFTLFLKSLYSVFLVPHLLDVVSPGFGLASVVEFLKWVVLKQALVCYPGGCCGRRGKVGAWQISKVRARVRVQRKGIEYVWLRGRWC